MVRALIIMFALCCASSASASAWEEPNCLNNMDGSVLCYVSVKIVFSDGNKKQDIGMGVVSGADGAIFPALFVLDSSWGMRNRAGVDVMLRVDDLPSVKRESNTQGGYIVMKLLPNDIEPISSGQSLYLTFPAFSARYSLDGSRAAIESLMAAVKSFAQSHDPFAGRDMAKSDPFASSNQGR